MFNFLKKEREAVTDVLLMFTSLCFNTPTSFVVLKKCASLDDPVLITLALCYRHGVGAV